MLTQERVRELFTYDSETGILSWRVSPARRVKIGDVAGYDDGRGYRKVTLDGKGHFIHRLIWLWNRGYLPEQGLDHINRKSSDNRMENLREVSQSCNMRNTANREDNTSGVRGVYWHGQRKKWVARIHFKGVTHHIGIHVDFDEAVCARLAAEQCLDWAGCDSESPAFRYVRDKIQCQIK